MNYIAHTYTFDASAKTVTYEHFDSLEDILLITNLVDNVIIYQFNNPAKWGTLSNTVLTLMYDTTAMSDTDELQITISPRVFQHGNTPVQEDSEAMVVAARPAKVDRIWFTKTISGWVDTSWWVIVWSIGTGMWINQTWWNLVVTSGTTARSETIIRSNDSFLGGIRLRSRSTLSQRIANNNFIVEMVDVVGDWLAYTISSATAIAVTFPTWYLSSQNVGQSMTIGLFSGTGTFLSWRYPIASVAWDVATFTVSWFAAGSGTCSVFWASFYRLLYDGTTATNAKFDTGRNGYATGDTTATISTTASPWHLAVITGNDLVATFADQLVASSATIKQTIRASRDENIPDDVSLRLQIRILNGSTAPASTTTWTIGLVSVTNYSPQSVNIQDVRPMGTWSALPVEIMRWVALATQPVSWSVTATVTPPAPATPYFLNSAATTNGALIITGTSWLTNFYATNEGASYAYVKLYNKATAPTVGTDVPEMTIPIPPAAAWVPGSVNLPIWFIWFRFALWLGIAITRNAVFSDITAIGASEVKVKLSRTV